MTTETPAWCRIGTWPTAHRVRVLRDSRVTMRITDCGRSVNGRDVATAEPDRPCCGTCAREPRQRFITYPPYMPPRADDVEPIDLDAVLAR